MPPHIHRVRRFFSPSAAFPREGYRTRIREMDAGAHIPSYLLCEQLAGQGRVADLFPPDERGARILARTAQAIVVVQSTASRFMAI